MDATMNAFSQAAEGRSEESGNLRYYPIPPRSPGGISRSNLWSWSLAMNSYSNNKEASWYFLQYFTGKQFQLESSIETPIVAAPRASTNANSEYQRIIGWVPGFNETFETMIPNTTMLYTPQPHIFEVLTEWSATIQRLVEGSYSSTQEGMDRLKERMDVIVEDVVVE